MRLGFHPVNLSFRFILELVSLVGIFRLGRHVYAGGLGWLVGLGLTLAAMALWALFRVPGDESAKGDAPVPVSGAVRLPLELVVFGAGAWGWFVGGPEWLAWTNLVLLLGHHFVSVDRISWLLRGTGMATPPRSW